KWPIYMGKFEGMIIEMQDKAYKSVPILRQFGDWKTLAAKAVGMMGSAPAFIIGLVPKLAMLILVPFISFFFMLEGRAMIDMLINLIPSKYVEIVQHVICEVDESLGNYLRGILIEATILFVMALLGLVSLEINYAVPIAVIVGLSSLVPYIGPLVGGLISAIAAFLQYNSLAMVLNVVIFFVSLRFIDDWVLQPMILKHAMQVHPVVIIFAIMAGAELFGIWGIIFAMPVTCIIKVVISVALELQRTEFAWKPKPEPTRISIPYT
ncbi:MAG: AI-2E family transporter, partial [Elusimicrobiaceae bacterium]